MRHIFLRKIQKIAFFGSLIQQPTTAMHRPIKVGVLSPFSTIYPNMGQDFIDGVVSGIPEKLRPSFQYFPEFIRQGEPQAVTPAIEKHLGFNHVDILTGLVSYRTIVQFLPTIEQFKTICLFGDMGEYVPFTDYRSDFLFFNSFQFWQAEYALGEWAQKEYGGKGAVLFPSYEAGYHMHNAFHLGVSSVGDHPLDFVMVPYIQDKEITIGDAIMEYIEKFRKERPSYVKALFSGTEATEFYRVWHREGLHKEIPLIVSPHMASPEILREITSLDMTFHGASLWDQRAEDPENMKFKSRFLELTGGVPNSFALLGYEIGLILEQLQPALMAREKGVVQKMLKEERVKTPRGERNFYLDSEYARPVIDIEKIRIEQNQVSKIAIGQGRSLPHHHFAFEKIHRENTTGWYNNYLCV